MKNRGVRIEIISNKLDGSSPRPHLRWYWRVRASNGKILCHSEQYNSKASAVKGVRVLYSAIFYRTFELYVDGVQEDPKHLVA